MLEWLGEWGAAISEHHERFDGMGYPRGLAGHEIAQAGRIVAVADSFEVMTAARSYKRPMSVATARRELADVAGTQLDPAWYGRSWGPACRVCCGLSDRWLC